MHGRSVPLDADTDVPILRWNEAEVRRVPWRHVSLMAVLQPVDSVIGATSTVLWATDDGSLIPV